MQAQQYDTESEAKAALTKGFHVFTTSFAGRTVYNVVRNMRDALAAHAKLLGVECRKDGKRTGGRKARPIIDAIRGLSAERLAEIRALLMADVVPASIAVAPPEPEPVPQPVVVAAPGKHGKRRK